jgi:hypothetical protein
LALSPDLLQAAGGGRVAVDVAAVIEVGVTLSVSDGGGSNVGMRIGVAIVSAGCGCRKAVGRAEIWSRVDETVSAGIYGQHHDQVF